MWESHDEEAPLFDVHDESVPCLTERGKPHLRRFGIQMAGRTAVRLDSI